MQSAHHTRGSPKVSTNIDKVLPTLFRARPFLHTNRSGNSSSVDVPLYTRVRGSAAHLRDVSFQRQRKFSDWSAHGGNFHDVSQGHLTSESQLVDCHLIVLDRQLTLFTQLSGTGYRTNAWLACGGTLSPDSCILSSYIEALPPRLTSAMFF